jgi:hypothetical protein
MKVTMVAGARPVLSLATGNMEYRVDKNGEMEVDEEDVEAARSMGLVAKGEVVTGAIARMSRAEANAVLASENERLKKLLEATTMATYETGERSTPKSAKK